MGPIYVCTRNDNLGPIIESTPADRRKDLVFFQNGMLDPLLEKYGLQLSPSNPNASTQCLVYFAVAKLGDKPMDGVTDLNPEGLTAAFGRHAESLAKRLRNAGVGIVVSGLPHTRKTDISTDGRVQKTCSRFELVREAVWTTRTLISHEHMSKLHPCPRYKPNQPPKFNNLTAWDLYYFKKRIGGSAPCGVTKDSMKYHGSSRCGVIGPCLVL